MFFTFVPINYIEQRFLEERNSLVNMITAVRLSEMYSLHLDENPKKDVKDCYTVDIDINRNPFCYNLVFL